MEIRAGAGSFYTPLSMQEPTREWVGFRPGGEYHERTIRRVAGSNVWLAYGHYRNGILLTPATAHLVAGQILDSNHGSGDQHTVVGCDSICLGDIKSIP